MNKYLYSIGVVALSISFMACKKENNTPTIPAMDRIDTSAQLRYSGSFTDGPYGTVTGTAKVLLKDNQFTLVLEDVSISNGPELHVYLSKEMQPVNFVDLGRLKSVSGTQVYEIAGMPNFEEYKFALVHCQRYNHLFGSAPLF